MKDINEVYDFIKDKKCVIVGPSESMKGSRYGSFIDSFDVVVRINNHFLIEECDIPDLGSRTDVLYHCIGRNSTQDRPCPDQWGHIPYVVYPMPKPMQKEDKFTPYIKKYGEIDFYIEPYEFIVNLGMKEARVKPHTGTSAIFHLLEKGAAEVHAIGFSFYRDGYAGYKKGWSREKALKHSKNCNHNIEREFAFFKTKIKEYTNFYPHGILKDVLEE